MKKLFTFLSLSVIYTGIFAQEQNSYQWQWAQTGGSADYIMWNEQLSFAQGAVANGETVNDIAVDKHNNIYFSTHIANNAQFMGHAIEGHNSTYENRSNSDIMIASVDCEGKYRWHYTIGGHYNDVVTNIETDTLGGVYISIQVTSSIAAAVDSVWFDSDTIFLQGGVPTLANGYMAIVKLDTLGKLQWIKWPCGTTDRETVKMYPKGLQVEPNGTAHWAMQVYEPGVYADGQMTITASDLQKGSNTVVMKYDRNGNFLGYTKLPIFNAGCYYTQQSSNNTIKDFRADFINKRYFLCGKQGGSSVPAIYIADYSIPTYTFNDDDWRGYVASFNFNGNYLWHHKLNCSTIYSMDCDNEGNLYVSTVTRDFGDVIHENTTDFFDANNIIVKILLTGEVHNEYRDVYSRNFTVSHTKYNKDKNEIGFIGVCPMPINEPDYAKKWIFLRLDKNALSAPPIDSVVWVSNSYNYGVSLYANNITFLTTDNQGNYLFGGAVGTEFQLSPSVHIANSGSGSLTDFFIAKYATHECGEEINDDIPEIQAAQNGEFVLYPNPAKNELIIKNEELRMENYSIFNIAGQVVVAGFKPDHNGETTIDVSHLPNGMYFIKAGNKVGKFVKN